MNQTAQQLQSAGDVETGIQPAETICADDQQQRAGAWALLGHLFRNSPDAQMLEHLIQLADADGGEEDELSLSLTMLGLAAGSTSIEAADDEFHALFVGLGRGELVPFGSWYQTGFLMEAPLSRLRDDLAVLGYQRDASVKEPEDHVAALADVMALLIQSDASLEQQSVFHATHIAPWLSRFFDDLSGAESAVFYRAVGRFGNAFAMFENQYLNMKV